MKTTLATMTSDCDASSLPLALGSECGAQCRALPARLAERRPASGLAFWPAARRVTARRFPGARGAGGGLSLLLAAGLAGSASAATYYVDATNWLTSWSGTGTGKVRFTATTAQSNPNVQEPVAGL